MNRLSASRVPEVLLVATSPVLGSCGPAAPQATPPSAQAPETETSAAGVTSTPRESTTPAEALPELSSLNIAVNGDPRQLEFADGQFQLSGVVNPHDILTVDATVTDDSGGTFTFEGKGKSYTPGLQLELKTAIPAYLQEAALPIAITGLDGQSTSYSVMFEAGKGFLPGVTVDIPADLYANHPVVIPVKIADVYGDNFTVDAQQVLGLGDKYTGNEYVTSQKLDFKWSEDGLSIQPQTPGNYRITLNVADKDGTTKKEIDLPVKWAPGENPFEIQGIAIDFWGPENQLDFNAVPGLIKMAHDIGANYVELAPNWHVNGVHGSEITSCNDLPNLNRPCGTPTDGQLRSWIQLAHKLGMSVLLKPHLMVGQYHSSTGAYDGDMWQMTPSDANGWFESYSAFITHFAQIANNEHVEMFSIGNEDMGTLRYRSLWDGIISDVRSVYDGKLTYSNVDLWTNGPTVASFWDKLDFIGVPYYFPGSTKNNTPTIDEMVAHIQQVRKGNLSKTMTAYDTPVIGTEMGRPNFNGTNYDPWNWSNREEDNQEQVDSLEAAFISQIDLGDRFKGSFYWVLKPREQTYEFDWDPRGKPVEGAISLWYSN